MDTSKFYIDGEWISPVQSRPFTLYNPATEEPSREVLLGSAADVDHAVAAARRAFQSFGETSRTERAALLRRIIDVYKTRQSELAQAISLEMGAPIRFAMEVQVPTPLGHFEEAIKVLENFEYEKQHGNFSIVREPIGVCGLITAWNWPLALIASKLAYALAAGCTVLLKPSEFAPLSPLLLAQIMHDAGVPKGVFNLVLGDGPTVGHAISTHPDVDMVSFTGSTRAGILVAQSAAETVKRVHQELGGKGANIILPDADLGANVAAGVRRAYTNAGQACQAPTRMLVHVDQYEQALDIAKAIAESIKVGNPSSMDTELGPVISKAQFDRVQRMIEAGIAEGATVVAGGTGRPADLNKGYYVRPTVFGNVDDKSTIAQQEIFGPVLPIIAYHDEEDAIRIANGTVYGLSAYVQTADPKGKGRYFASKLRAGRVYVNTLVHDLAAPFGGYKQSGNGREQGHLGFEEYLEVKAILT